MTHMQTGRERLAQWIDRAKLTDRETARQIGMDHTQLSQILNGKRTPGLQNAIKIEQATGIPVEAWVSTEDAETASVGSASGRKSRIGKA